MTDLPDELLALATSLAADAAAMLLDGLSRTRLDVTTKSSPTDMVTEMDRASEALIVAGIRAHRPDDGIVGEEGADVAGTSGVRWLIDPVDGTTNYLYGHPGFSVSIAAERDGEVLAGVVHDPMGDEVFAARLGGGATRNGERIERRPHDDVATALVATGFSYDPERRRRQAAVLVEVLPRVRDIRRMGGAALDLCSVAIGRVDAFYERGLSPWDHGAGALVASEAGARVGDLWGGPASTAFVLATAPGIFEELRELLLDAGAADA